MMPWKIEYVVYGSGDYYADFNADRNEPEAEQKAIAEANRLAAEIPGIVFTVERLKHYGIDRQEIWNSDDAEESP